MGVCHFYTRKYLIGDIVQTRENVTVYYTVCGVTCDIFCVQHDEVNIFQVARTLSYCGFNRTIRGWECLLFAFKVYLWSPSFSPITIYKKNSDNIMPVQIKIKLRCIGINWGQNRLNLLCWIIYFCICRNGKFNFQH